MIVGALILITTIAAWKTQHQHRIVVWSATLALGFLPVQVVLGGLTVTELLQPVIVTAHLGVAVLIVLSLSTATAVAWIREYQ